MSCKLSDIPNYNTRINAPHIQFDIERALKEASADRTKIDKQLKNNPIVKSNNSSLKTKWVDSLGEMQLKSGSTAPIGTSPEIEMIWFAIDNNAHFNVARDYLTVEIQAGGTGDYYRRTKDRPLVRKIRVENMAELKELLGY